MKIFLQIFLLLFSTILFSQQTTEFKMVKDYYNQHRNLLKKEFNKKISSEKDIFNKANITKDYHFFMQKMDSIENVALVHALLKVKNNEDLERLNLYKKYDVSEKNNEISLVTENIPEYPGGISALREEVAYALFSDGVYSESDPIKTEVQFVVEKNGKITNVKAEGANFTFNRQAEIAVYSLTGNFSPAILKGTPVRYRFRLPLTLKIN